MTSDTRRTAGGRRPLQVSGFSPEERFSDENMRLRVVRLHVELRFIKYFKVLFAL